MGQPTTPQHPSSQPQTAKPATKPAPAPGTLDSTIRPQRKLLLLGGLARTRQTLLNLPRHTSPFGHRRAHYTNADLPTGQK